MPILTQLMDLKHFPLRGTQFIQLASKTPALLKLLQNTHPFPERSLRDPHISAIHSFDHFVCFNLLERQSEGGKEIWREVNLTFLHLLVYSINVHNSQG